MKNFEQPDLEIIRFEYEDIMDVTVSGDVGNTDDEFDFFDNSGSF